MVVAVVVVALSRLKLVVVAAVVEPEEMVWTELLPAVLAEFLERLPLLQSVAQAVLVEPTAPPEAWLSSAAAVEAAIPTFRPTDLVEAVFEAVAAAVLVRARPLFRV